ncbi:MAG TPA: DUF305 domain-containing protein [Ilumatobacteraceae bacterium]|nr:DUF305 domain-containing protein [Ilumatobacteraceae bacterium]
MSHELDKATATPDTDTDIDDNTGTDGNTTITDADDVRVLPWYANPINIGALLIAVLVLAGVGGFVIGERNATERANDVDRGFLQDMRAHHEQAVEMSMIVLLKNGIGDDGVFDPDLAVTGGVKTVAQSIIVGQMLEIGRMVQMLRYVGADEANTTGTAMAWMNQAVPLERMPGMASEADLDTLFAAQGADAATQFIDLMITHHEGGIAMAIYARDHAATDEVRTFAQGVIDGQQGEIHELEGLRGG